MRDIDNDIRASLERLTNPHDGTPGTDALWGDLVDRRRKRRNRNRALAALPLLLVALLTVGVFSTRDSSDSTRSDVAAGDGERQDTPDDFAPFEMTYRTLSYQGGEMVPSTWSLRYLSWADWETTLVDGGLGVAEEPGFRRALSDGTLTEYNSDGTVRLEEPVDGRLAPLALMSQGPRTGKAEGGDNDSTYRHEYTSTQEHECPADPADGAPYCDQAGGTVVVETVEAFNEDGVPVFAEERIANSDRVVWQFETLTYERLGSSEDCASADSSRPNAQCGGVYGPVMFGPEQHGVMEQARLAGRVLLEGDCLYLMQESDAARNAPLPIVWPYGTLWEEGPAGARLADGTFVPVGAEITAAGGGHDIDRLVGLGHAESVAGRARQCAGDDVEVVAYVQGELDVTAADPETDENGTLDLAAAVEAATSPAYDFELVSTSGPETADDLDEVHFLLDGVSVKALRQPYDVRPPDEALAADNPYEVEVLADGSELVVIEADSFSQAILFDADGFMTNLVSGSQPGAASGRLPATALRDIVLRVADLEDGS